MEWEKTINHTPQCELSNIKINFGKCTCGMAQQAEISYKSGYEAGLVTSKEIDIDLESERLIDTGRQEMAKEIIAEIEMAHGIDIKSPNTTYIHISKMWWQTICKKWLGEK